MCYDTPHQLNTPTVQRKHKTQDRTPVYVTALQSKGSVRLSHDLQAQDF